MMSSDFGEHSPSSKIDRNEFETDSVEILDESFEETLPKQATKLERSLTLTGVDDRKNDNAVENVDALQPLSMCLSLPVLIQTSSSVIDEEAPAPRISPKTCLPPSLVASVDSATLEARERVLASLKEKVRRVEVGPYLAENQ